MKKLALLGMALCFVASLAIAQETEPTQSGAEITLKGDIIDNMCAGSQKPEELAGFVNAHTKECALKPECAASGYSIFADGNLYKFDKESSVKVEEFLRMEEGKLQVVITAQKAGDELRLLTIKNQ